MRQNHRSISVVPIEDLELLEALEEFEDIQEARLALQEIEREGSIPFEEMKKRLG